MLYTRGHRISHEVEQALEQGRAVVALESTVITHGLPKPENLSLARELESAVRQGGAVPATVGVVRGELVIGLDEGELSHLANTRAHKASLWNLAALMAQAQDAGTTVATTLFAADRAGIRVFATGGIGGVHHAPFDESADLVALACYPLAVVCAGAKSLLDQRATLERLESLGVAVVGYKSDYLAGFYVPQTSLPIPARCESPEAVAACLVQQRALGLKQALLVSNPVSAGLDAQEVDTWVSQANREANQTGLTGETVTPFVLARLAELSAGRSVSVNLRLLKENALLAAAIAQALAHTREPTLTSW